MLGDFEAVATIAVKDMDKARKFYEETLGLESKKSDDPGGVMYKTGRGGLFIYQSSYAGSNRATYAAWSVGDKVDKLIAELKGKGIKFEHYKMPDVKLEGDVHVFGKLRAAWFKDPDGNILNIVNM